MTSTRLGDRVGVRLFLKCENFQKTGSFKVRGVAEQAEPARSRGARARAS